MWVTHLVYSWLLYVMMRGEWGVTGGKIYSTVLQPPPPPLWPARIFINNNNLPSIHVIRKQTRAKLVAKATRGLPFE